MVQLSGLCMHDAMTRVQTHCKTAYCPTLPGANVQPLACGDALDNLKEGNSWKHMLTNSSSCPAWPAVLLTSTAAISYCQSLGPKPSNLVVQSRSPPTLLAAR